jgi:predicted nuclease with TOPRIM domain
MDQEITEQKPPETSKRTVFIVIILILFATNLLLIWQYFQKKEHLEEVSQSLQVTLMDKDQLSAELQKVKQEYEVINKANGELQNQLLTKDDEIKSKIAQIQRLIASGDAASLKQAKLEITALKDLNVRYSMEIDSLKSANQQLHSQNQNLNTNLSDAQTQVASLTQQNLTLSNKVAIGSILKATDLVTSAVRIKGNGKEVEVSRASSAEQVKIVFTILENLVADKGVKDIYIRIMSPSGSVLTSTQETILVNGQPSLFSLHETVQYNNKDTEVTAYYPKSIAFVKGKYQVELYHQNLQIGAHSFTLK